MLAKIFRVSFVAAILVVLMTILSPGNVNALDVPARPTDIPIVDQTGTLNDTQKATLASKIGEERTKSGNQIAIVMIASLEDESIETYALDISRQWGIGTKQNNNGVLLLVVKDDRRMRIEVGAGLEGALTDAQAGRIIRDDISPEFRQGKYYEGIDAGLTGIVATINGEYEAAPTAPSSNFFPWELLLGLGFLVFSWLGSVLARTKSWWAGGIIGATAGGATGLLAESLFVGLTSAAALGVAGLVLDKIVSANYRSHARRGNKPSWWAGGGFLGGGGSGGGGGGFGGFGGGGFSGGGSSGSW